MDDGRQSLSAQSEFCFVSLFLRFWLLECAPRRFAPATHASPTNARRWPVLVSPPVPPPLFLILRISVFRPAPLAPRERTGVVADPAMWVAHEVGTFGLRGLAVARLALAPLPLLLLWSSPSRFSLTLPSPPPALAHTLFQLCSPPRSSRLPRSFTLVRLPGPLLLFEIVADSSGICQCRRCPLRM